MIGRAATLALLGAACAALANCGPGGPSPALYVLGTPPAPTSAARPVAGLPVVELKPVRVPDYLDTTDLVVRDDGQLVPSRTGRWGERLSVGATRALGTALAARLPRLLVTTAPPVERPAWQVLVDLDTFEARRDGQIVLTGRWSVTDGAGRATLAAERVSLVEPLAGAGDAAVAAAMTRDLEALAARIAAAFERLAAAAGPGR
jgi:uncharacterized lipoprotein YmbA